jgi:low affinity Fe/Cu permease
MGRGLTALGVWTARPTAFAVVSAYGTSWAILHGIDWHGVATLATWLMTLFIQRAEHRDTQAIHAKLDELLRSDRRADSELSGLDKAQPEEIEEVREAQAPR